MRVHEFAKQLTAELGKEVKSSQIDAISGATITTNAVTTAVNAGLYIFETQLGGDR